MPAHRETTEIVRASVPHSRDSDLSQLNIVHSHRSVIRLEQIGSLARGRVIEGK